MEQINIRSLKEQDIKSILFIINHNILHSTAVYDYEPKTLPEIKAWYEERQQAGFPIIVAVTDNEILGYGSYVQFKAKEGYKFCVEHSVYVAPGHTGKGIGKLLLAELITLAKVQGMHSMVGLIDADNKESIAFHLKFGFKEAGLLQEAGFKFNRWLNVQFMQLTLT